MYRKFKAGRIFNGYDFLPDDAVIIIKDDGEIIDIVEETNAGNDIEYFDGILSPGFINCHCHLELSHLKGLIPKHTGLVDFVFKIVTERHFAEPEILAAIETGEKEMFNNGIVAIGDICNNGLTIAQKTKGNIWYRNFIETSGVPPAAAPVRFQQSEALYNAYAAQLSANSIVPHAPYSVSPELFQLINDFADNKILSIHNQEIAAENELFENKSGDFLRMYDKMNIDISFFKASGKSSLQTFLPYLNKVASLLLVHNVCTSDEDITFANNAFGERADSLFFCLCPNANLYISNEMPPVEKFMNHSCNIVLGTDSLASNDQLNMLEEIKTISKYFPAIELKEMLQWATSNGARALGCDHLYGRLQKGLKPGIVFIDSAYENNISNATAKRLL